MARAARCRSRRGGSSRALQGRSNTSAHIWGETEKRRVSPRARAAGRGPSQERRTHPRAAGLSRPGERLRAAPARRSAMRSAARPGHAPPPSRLDCSRAPPAGRSAHRCSPSASLCSRGPAVAPLAALFLSPVPRRCGSTRQYGVQRTTAAVPSPPCPCSSGNSSKDLHVL